MRRSGWYVFFAGTFGLLLTLASPACLASIYGILEGRVVRAEDGRPLPGATVRVNGTSRGSFTDMEGKFRIVKIEAGRYDITVSYVSYRNKTLHDVDIRADEVTRRHVRMVSENAPYVAYAGDDSYRSRRTAPPQLREWVRERHPATRQPDRELSVAGLSVSGRHARPGMHFYSAVTAPLLNLTPMCESNSWAELKHRAYLDELFQARRLRVDEVVNAVPYDYAAPHNSDFSIHSELTSCPWDTSRHLLTVAVCARRNPDERSAHNVLHVVVDVSGSMQQADKIGMFKQVLSKVVRQSDVGLNIALYSLYKGRLSTIVEPVPAGATWQRNKQDKLLLSKLSDLNIDPSVAGENIYYALCGVFDSLHAQSRMLLVSDGGVRHTLHDGSQQSMLVDCLRSQGVALDIVTLQGARFNSYKLSAFARGTGGEHTFVRTSDDLQQIIEKSLNNSNTAIARNPVMQFDFNPRLVGSYRQLGGDAQGHEAWYYAPLPYADLAVPYGMQHIIQFEIVPALPLAPSGSAFVDYKLTELANFTRELARVRLQYTENSTGRYQRIDHSLTPQLEHIDSVSADTRLAASLACATLSVNLAPGFGEPSLDIAARLLEGNHDDPHDDPVRREAIDLISQKFFLVEPVRR